jgi:DNA-binding transcriptional MerR regulator
MKNSSLKIGQVAAQCGVSPDTIRHYEKLGLIPRAARSASGYRLYPPGVLQRLGIIRNGLRFGFSLKQLQQFLSSRDAGIPPCRQVHAAAEQILLEMETHIGELIEARNAMRRTLHDWDARLARTPEDAAAELLCNVSTESSGIVRTLIKGSRFFT